MSDITVNPLSLTCAYKTNNVPVKSLCCTKITLHKGSKLIMRDLGRQTLNSNLAEEFIRNLFAEGQ